MGRTARKAQRLNGKIGIANPARLGDSPAGEGLKTFADREKPVYEIIDVDLVAWGSGRRGRIGAQPTVERTKVTTKTRT